jgi:hypothetical protein
VNPLRAAVAALSAVRPLHTSDATPKVLAFLAGVRDFDELVGEDEHTVLLEWRTQDGADWSVYAPSGHTEVRCDGLLVASGYFTGLSEKDGALSAVLEDDQFSTADTILPIGRAVRARLVAMSYGAAARTKAL